MSSCCGTAPAGPGAATGQRWCRSQLLTRIVEMEGSAGPSRRGATCVTLPRGGRLAAAPGLRRESQPDRAVHCDIHRARHRLGGDSTKDRGCRAGSLSGRMLVWRLAAAAHPVAGVARARPHPVGSRPRPAGLLLGYPRPNPWAVTAAYGGRARMMPLSLLRRPVTRERIRVDGCDASNPSGRGGRGRPRASGPPHARTTGAAQPLTCPVRGKMSTSS